ncbi:uncharacterized protein LOC113869106 isoform X3 [Abrus precatorius]|uniref:Uncharacterized protein LOC113869106 isoform X3 n=1 Tax=Abrus precatorius TaxID=3816 RepID=A0A8B8LXR2_ABRPR|nr:uncharacterized protein LOC113869106 isoform X3 [Abrus precatorius]
MVISNTIILSNSPVGTPSIPTSTVAKLETFSLKNDGVIRIRGVSASSVAPRNRKLASCSVSGGGNASVGIDVPFPTDYTQLLEQARVAVELAMKDNTQLMFFPEASEVDFARQSAFSGSSFKLDYLTKPSFFEDFGFVEKVKMSDRVKTGDELFLVAYPYFNVNEMLVVEELYKEAVLNTERKLIIFNGELDRIRSGYYPPFFYPKLAALTKTFLPMMETVYYIHNFKGRNGGTLFRCYPGPWKVLRRVGSSNKYVCLHQQNSMPSLKEVALEILPTT